MNNEQKRRAKLYRTAAERIAREQAEHTCIAVSCAAQYGVKPKTKLPGQGHIAYYAHPDAQAWVAAWGFSSDNDTALLNAIAKQCGDDVEEQRAKDFRMTLLCFAAAMVETGDL